MRRSVLALGVMLVACNPDDGKPTDPIKELVPDGGEAGASASSTNLPIGADCTDAKQCASGNCFIGGKASWCTVPCTPDNAATVCVPVPPLDGTCNKQGLCRRP
jgi:hypothetical protein